LRLTYGDVDFNGSRICVGKARTKGRTAGQRWLPVPGGMPDQVAALVPLEDRERDRRVFPGLTDALVRKDLALLDCSSRFILDSGRGDLCK
jgi:hypothetical protein